MITQVKRGDCEVCDLVNIDVYLMHGNILMCESCREQELAVMASTLVEESRKIDSSIQLKTEVFNAATVAAIELRAAIEQDPSIPADQKEFVYAKECMVRFKNLQQVIFEERKALQEKENELRMWQTNVQTTAGKLREEYKAQFKEMDIAYQPAPVKTQKIKSVVKQGKKFNKNAVMEAAKKYNVSAVGIQTMVVSRNMLPEDAAKELALLTQKH